MVPGVTQLHVHIQDFDANVSIYRMKEIVRSIKQTLFPSNFRSQ